MVLKFRMVVYRYFAINSCFPASPLSLSSYYSLTP
uniref:Uncharacterized protein n=1 Tax=Anopheles quadriannulatus TaxID=34691 RepID=A0A182XSD3_ANOQN